MGRRARGLASVDSDLECWRLGLRLFGCGCWVGGCSFFGQNKPPHGTPRCARWGRTFLLKPQTLQPYNPKALNPTTPNPTTLTNPKALNPKPSNHKTPNRKPRPTPPHYPLFSHKCQLFKTIRALLKGTWGSWPSQLLRPQRGGRSAQVFRLYGLQSLGLWGVLGFRKFRV